MAVHTLWGRRREGERKRETEGEREREGGSKGEREREICVISVFLEGGGGITITEKITELSSQ